MQLNPIQRSISNPGQSTPDIEQGGSGAAVEMTAVRRPGEARSAALQAVPARPRGAAAIQQGRAVAARLRECPSLCTGKGFLVAATVCLTGGVVLMGVGLRHGIPHPYSHFVQDDPNCHDVTTGSMSHTCEGVLEDYSSEDVNADLLRFGGISLGIGASLAIMDLCCRV